MMQELVIATRNEGKIREFKQILAGLPLVLLSLGDLSLDHMSIAEDESTLRGNAFKKASTIAEQTHKLTLADDSGLEVDVLEGKPGVYSARYAGPHATDEQNRAKLLTELTRLREKGFSEPFFASFRCVLAVVKPSRDKKATQSFFAEGVCSGRIVLIPRGIYGFGYDPIFEVDLLDKTMAELLPEEKNRISHRARAFSTLRSMLLPLVT